MQILTREKDVDSISTRKKDVIQLKLRDGSEYSLKAKSLQDRNAWAFHLQVRVFKCVLCEL